MKNQRKTEKPDELRRDNIRQDLTEPSNNMQHNEKLMGEKNTSYSYTVS